MKKNSIHQPLNIISLLLLFACSSNFNDKKRGLTLVNETYKSLITESKNLDDIINYQEIKDKTKIFEIKNPLVTVGEKNKNKEYSKKNVLSKLYVNCKDAILDVITQLSMGSKEEKKKKLDMHLIKRYKPYLKGKITGIDMHKYPNLYNFYEFLIKECGVPYVKAAHIFEYLLDQEFEENLVDDIETACIINANNDSFIIDALFNRFGLCNNQVEKIIKKYKSEEEKDNEIEDEKLHLMTKSNSYRKKLPKNQSAKIDQPIKNKNKSNGFVTYDFKNQNYILKLPLDLNYESEVEGNFYINDTDLAKAKRKVKRLSKNDWRIDLHKTENWDFAPKHEEDLIKKLENEYQNFIKNESFKIDYNTKKSSYKNNMNLNSNINLNFTKKSNQITYTLDKPINPKFSFYKNCNTLGEYFKICRTQSIVNELIKNKEIHSIRLFKDSIHYTKILNGIKTIYRYSSNTEKLLVPWDYQGNKFCFAPMENYIEVSNDSLSNSIKNLNTTIDEYFKRVLDHIVSDIRYLGTSTNINNNKDSRINQEVQSLKKYKYSVGNEISKFESQYNQKLNNLIEKIKSLIKNDRFQDKKVQQVIKYYFDASPYDTNFDKKKYDVSYRINNVLDLIDGKSVILPKRTLIDIYNLEFIKKKQLMSKLNRSKFLSNSHINNQEVLFFTTEGNVLNMAKINFATTNPNVLFSLVSNQPYDYNKNINWYTLD